MKRTLTLITAIFITLFSIKAQAQDDDIDNQARGYFGFIGGLSAPLGAYGSTNYSNNSSGYAKTSGMGGLDIAFYLHKNFGIGITFTYQDQGELNSNDVLNLATGYNNSFFKDETTIAAVNRYENLTLMAGPQYSFVHKKFTLDLRADAGVLKSISTPYLTIVFDYSANDNQSYYQLSSGSLAFAYGASAGLRYALSDSWDVGFKVNYVNTNDLKIENSGPAAETGRYQTSLPVNVVQASLGIMIKF